jgi:hypothetical protein
VSFALTIPDVPAEPRVTQVIDMAGLGADFSMVPKWRLAQAIERGNLVHRAVQLVDENDLDDRSVPEHLTGYVASYRLWKTATAYRPIRCEEDVYHPTWRYWGRPDKQGFLGTERVMPDIKTAVSLSPGPLLLQLAAYRLAHNAMRTTEPVSVIGSLQPQADGRMAKWRRVNVDRAERVFLYALRMLRGEANATELAEIERWARTYAPKGSA